MSNVDQDLQKLEQLITALVNMLKLPEDLARSLAAQSKGSYKEEHSMKSIINHVQQGGKVECVRIEAENAEAFRERLLREHISHHMFQVINENGEVSYNFLFKDSDHERLSTIKKTFEIELSTNAMELDIYTFKNLMRGKEVAICDGLSITDIYMFRQNAKNTGIKYVIAKDKDNTFKIYADSTEKLSKTLLASKYDVIADKDCSYKNAVENYIDKYTFIKERAMNEKEIVIVDKKNPEHFLTLGPNGFSEHYIQPRDITKADGTVVRELVDTIKPQVFSMEDNFTLMDKLARFRQGIILDTKDFYLLKSVNKNGEAFVSDDFIELREKFIDEHKDDVIDIPKQPKKYPEVNRADVTGLVNIPIPVVNNMMKEFDFIYHDGSGNICFPKDKAKEVDTYLKENVYVNLPKENILAFDWMIHGRTDGMLPDFFAQSEEFKEFCVLNLDRKVTVDVTKHGIEIYDAKSQLIETCENTSPEYINTLLKYINEDYCPNPVVLTANEMMLSKNEKQAIIDNRVTNNIHNPAIDYLCDKEIREKDQLLHPDKYKGITLSEEQKETMSRMKEVNIEQKIFNGAVFTEMQNLETTHSIDRGYDR